MRFQRAGAGGNPVEMQFIKWTTEGMVKGREPDIHISMISDMSEYSMTWGIR